MGPHESNLSSFSFSFPNRSGQALPPTDYISLIGIHTLWLKVTRGYRDHSPLTTHTRRRGGPAVAWALGGGGGRKRGGRCRWLGAGGGEGALRGPWWARAMVVPGSATASWACLLQFLIKLLSSSSSSSLWRGRLGARGGEGGRGGKREADWIRRMPWESPRIWFLVVGGALFY